MRGILIIMKIYANNNSSPLDQLVGKDAWYAVSFPTNPFMWRWYLLTRREGNRYYYYTVDSITINNLRSYENDEPGSSIPKIKYYVFYAPTWTSVADLTDDYKNYSVSEVLTTSELFGLDVTLEDFI